MDNNFPEEVQTSGKESPKEKPKAHQANNTNYINLTREYSLVGTNCKGNSTLTLKYKVRKLYAPKSKLQYNSFTPTRTEKTKEQSKLNSNSKKKTNIRNEHLDPSTFDGTKFKEVTDGPNAKKEKKSSEPFPETIRITQRMKRRKPYQKLL